MIRRKAIVISRGWDTTNDYHLIILPRLWWIGHHRSIGFKKWVNLTHSSFFVEQIWENDRDSIKNVPNKNLIPFIICICPYTVRHHSNLVQAHCNHSTSKLWFAWKITFEFYRSRMPPRKIMLPGVYVCRVAVEDEYNNYTEINYEYNMECKTDTLLFYDATKWLLIHNCRMCQPSESPTSEALTSTQLIGNSTGASISYVILNF